MAEIESIVLAEVMLWLMYGSMAIALLAVGFSALRSMRYRTESIGASNRVPRRSIAIAVGVATVVLLVAACLLGSAQPMVINGVSYTNSFWLKVSDGLIAASVLLMGAAACIVAYGISGLSRRTTKRVKTAKPHSIA